MAFSWAARAAESDSAQLRGETECCPLPKKATDSGDMYQWGWIWTPPVAVREGVGTGCFQGGPLWLQQASVVPTTTPPNPICTPTPTLRTPLCPPPSRSLAWQTGSLLYSAGKWQPCGGPEGLVGVFPQGSSSFHPTPKGANPGSQHI